MEHAAHELAPLAVHAARWLGVIPLLPLLGAMVNAAVGWRWERAGHKARVHLVAVGTMAAAFLVTLVAFVTMLRLPGDQRFLQATLWNMFEVGPLRLDAGLALDPLSMMMTLVVTGIGTLIHVFSIGYMWDDEARAYWRFFAWLELFIFSMLLLVMGDNLGLVFFGWEGVGLCSYGLIGYYYTDREKAAAGMKAFVVNRVGDFGFLLGLLLLFWTLGGAWAASSGVRGADWKPAAVAAEAAPAGEPAAAPAAEHVQVKVGPTLNLRELRDQVVIEGTGIGERLRQEHLGPFALITLICVLLFVGAMGKSAQIPLYVWLPDAMAGPTPVSALIHAATMVTAGVYLVARLNFLFVLSPAAMAWVALIGTLTAVFAASIGLFQYDIKKVLAYSTVSQLGFMFIGVGVGTYWAGAFHLLTHAFFKATLFLAAGSVILGCHHEQDMRRMGGLAKYMPRTRLAYLVACWAIAGFPFASGFYSKDEILWKAFTSGHLALFGVPTPWLGPAIWALGLLAATGTSFYMFRSYYMTFTGTWRGGGGHAHEHGEDPHAATATPHHADASGHHDAHVAPDTAAPLHAHTPHESPVTVTFVILTLAAGAVLTGLLGIPGIWTGGEPLLERWLSPALTAEVSFVEKSHATELLFQLLGVGVATFGWLAARVLYKDGRSTVPRTLQARFTRVWQVVYDKYYVDELYGATVIRGTTALSAALAWIDRNVIDGLVNLAGTVTRGFAGLDGLIDRYLVDGAVNGVAGLVKGSGQGLRHLQTGRVQTYLYGALAGGVVLILFGFLFH